jgi:hypothetical protein
MEAALSSEMLMDTSAGVYNVISHKTVLLKTIFHDWVANMIKIQAPAKYF